MLPKIPIGYYVYTITVDKVVRYIGKGKGLRVYFHMTEVRRRLRRKYKLRSIHSRLQRNLTRAVISGAKIVETVLLDELTEKAAYKLEYERLREYVYAGKREQLWNETANIQTPAEQQAFIRRLKRNLNSRDKWIRYLSGSTLASLEAASKHAKEATDRIALRRQRSDRPRTPSRSDAAHTDNRMAGPRSGAAMTHKARQESPF